MILFICHGNVARSQIAEALLEKEISLEVKSAGTHVPVDKEGNLLSHEGPQAINAVDYFLKITGIDISQKKRKLITPELVSEAERIIVMTEKENLPDYVFESPDKVEFWKIRDPRYMDIAGYRKIIRQIQKKIKSLKDSLQ